MQEKPGTQIEQFLLYLRSQKNASQHTVTGYLADIEDFIEFAKLQGVGGALFDSVTPIIIRAFLSSLKALGYAPSTIARRSASLSSFYRFLCRRGLAEDNPVAGLHTPKPAFKPSFTLGDEEIAQLLALPGTDDLGQRDRAVLELLYAAGMQVAELARLSTGDIDCTNRLLLVGSPNAGQRLVPIGRKAAAAVSAYLAGARQRLCSRYSGTTHDKLLVNHKGGPLTDRSIRRIVKKYAGRLELAPEVSPRTLRHTLAAHLLSRGADLSSVREILGLDNLFATPFSTCGKERLKTVYMHTHPRA